MYMNCSECQNKSKKTICIHNMFSPYSGNAIFMYWTCNSMNNPSSCCVLVDAKIIASDKDTLSLSQKRVFSNNLNFQIYLRSNVCVEALAKCETIAPLKRAMNLRKDLIYAACETFSTIFGGHHDTLVKQVSYSLYLLICELFPTKTVNQRPIFISQKVPR